jgi:NAD(P)-dependent dehydrogenase (short-subunit alcohol dehydrogenase family)
MADGRFHSGHALVDYCDDRLTPTVWAVEISLEDKVAIVTGGSRGIGLEIATTFANAGAKVLIVSRKAEALEAAAAEVGNGCAWLAGNVGNPGFADAAVDHAIETFGGVDILVNNAATNPYAGPTIDVDIPRWDKTISVNLTAPLVWTQAAWRKTMQENGGAIINISSVGGLMTSEVIGVYDMTKAALIHLTQQLGAELGPKVRVNAICPGLIKTEFARALWEGEGGEKIAKAYPLQRLGETTDVANAAIYLASDASSWITGQHIVLDGGGLVAFRRRD